MSKEIVIHFIYAEDCEDCVNMLNTIKLAIEKNLVGTICRINKINSESSEAIKIAIDNDIDDLPACVIGNKAFSGKYYTYSDVADAIEEARKGL